MIAVFTMIGGGLKYIDEAFDEETFNKKIATILATILIILWLGISTLDTSAGTILLAVLLGVIFSGKIDNSIFEKSTATIFGGLLFYGKFLVTPLVFLTLTGILDEKGNDYVDSHKPNRFLEFFFLHRFTMKIALALLCYAGYFGFQYLIGFLFFDIAYDTIGLASKNSKQKIILETNLAGEKPIKTSELNLS